MAHPFTGSWGYQVTGYFAPSPRFGSPDDLRAFVDRLHGQGIGVILDWVPAHFPRDDFALARFDGTALYEHDDPRRGAHPDWGTLVFNYGRHEVRNFLVANALYWLREYHADGIRVDAVASMLYLDYSREEGEWVPNEFGGNEDLDAVALPQGAQRGASTGASRASISAAEESTAWPGVSRPTYLGGLGFGFKWNMGWMHDTLGYFQQDPVHRRYHHHELTFSLVYAFTRELRAPALPRRGRARQGLAVRRRCPATAGRSSPTCARSTPTCGRTPARSCCSWARSSPRSASGATSARSTGTCSRAPTTPACSRSCATSTAPTRPSRRCGSRTSTRRASTGSSPTTPRRTSSPSPRSSRDGERVLVFVANLSPVPRHGYRLGLPRAGRWREAAQHRRRLLRRRRRRQPRRRRGRADPVGRPAVLGGDHAAAARGPVAGPWRVALSGR